MKPRSIIGEVAASFSGYDWTLTLGAYALGVVALGLHAPLWAAAVVAFSGSAIVGAKHTFRNLGLPGDHDGDERGAMPPSDTAGPMRHPTRQARTQPAAARNR